MQFAFEDVQRATFGVLKSCVGLTISHPVKGRGTRTGCISYNNQLGGVVSLQLLLIHIGDYLRKKAIHAVLEQRGVGGRRERHRNAKAAKSEIPRRSSAHAVPLKCIVLAFAVFDRRVGTVR